MSTLFNSKMVIITGANGNLGTAVTSHFLEKGYKIIATTHDEEGKNGLPNHENLQVRVINLTNETESASFIQSCIDENKKNRRSPDAGRWFCHREHSHYINR